MSSPYQSQASGDIANDNVLPSDGDAAVAASVDVPFETITDDVFRLRARASLDECTTFVEPSDGLGIIATGGNVAGEMCIEAWQIDRRLIHANNEATAGVIRKSYDGGYTWTSEFTNATSVWLGLASQSDSSAAIETSVGAHIALAGPGNAWTLTSISSSGSVTPSCIVADPFNASTYWVGGVDGTTPKVWKQVSVSGVSPPTQTQIALTGGVAGVNVVCAGRNAVLAASNDSGTSHLWSIVAGVGTVVTPPSATFITDILWLDAFGIFLLIASDGSSAFELWTSPTGATATWTAVTGSYLVSLEANAFVSHSFIRGACVVGPLAGGLKAPCLVMLPLAWVAPSSTTFILVSADGGTTWRPIPDPLQRHQSASPKAKVTRVRAVGNRVAALGYQAAGAVYHALSGRGGMPV